MLIYRTTAALRSSFLHQIHKFVKLLIQVTFVRLLGHSLSKCEEYKSTLLLILWTVGPLSMYCQFDGQVYQSEGHHLPNCTRTDWIQFDERICYWEGHPKLHSTYTYSMCQFENLLYT